MPLSRTTVCWAAKGGSGTTVVTAAIGLLVDGPVVLVDLAGDLPGALGLAEPGGPGVHDWVLSDADDGRLADLAVSVTDDVRLVPAGVTRAPADASGWGRLVDALGSVGSTVVVDAGTGVPPAALHERCRTLLVTRACYLALRRVVTQPVRPTGVVLVDEPGRALRAVDVETAVGAPVVATVALDPAVARAVDAGLLTCRLPRGMRHDLRGAA